MRRFFIPLRRWRKTSDNPVQAAGAARGMGMQLTKTELRSSSISPNYSPKTIFYQNFISLKKLSL